MSKKVVLFIVEGISDELSLSVGLQQIIQNHLVKFKVIFGDITSDIQTTTSNVKIKIRDKVVEFINQNSYKPSDILEIIHVVDTDGTYIPDSAIISNPIAEKFIYNTHSIECCDVNQVIQRNTRKRNNIDVLIHHEYVVINRKQISYKIFYMSSNLDHVLHHITNLEDDEKTNKAFEFSIACKKDLNLFMNTLYSCLPLNCDYDQSWRFIKEGLHSLNRFNNLIIYLDGIKTARYNQSG